MKNSLLNSLVKILPKPRFSPRDKERPRFLVVSTTGLGDTLWGTPSLRALKKSYPKSFIALLTSPVGAALLKNNPHIDATFIVKNPALSSLPFLYRPLKKLKLETALIFHTSQRSLLPFVKLLGPSRIIAVTGINKGLDTLLTDPLLPHYEHEIARRLRITCATGAHACGNEMELFIEAPLPQNFSGAIALHPGAKDRFKQWAPRHFAAVGNALKSKGPILITGTLDEHSLCEEIAMQIPGSLNLAGKLSLEEMAALLKELKLFITNDTGPMHMALAQKTPTLALFGPTDPHLCGPYNSATAKIFAVPKTCHPCLKKKCRAPFCMSQIGPQEVIKAAEEVLS